MTLLLVYLFVAVGVSFLCSLLEASLLSVPRSHVAVMVERGSRAGKRLEKMKDDVDRPLAAILTLNTIAHTVGAIGAGAKATAVFGSAWFGVFSAVMTLLILFASEIVPKTMGAVHWAFLAGPTALFVRALIVGLFPIVWISERLTRLIAHGRDLHVFSREEFIAMAQLGEQTGHIDDDELRIIHNLFRFGSMRAVDVMTPRPVITAFPEDMTIADALDRVTESPFSRLPVHRTGDDGDDAMTGFVLKDEVLTLQAQGRGDETLASIKREIASVPETVPLSRLLERLLRERQHIAIVLDEFGETQGLVTLEDLVETLMGREIVDETDAVADMRELARRQWLQRRRELNHEGRLAEDEGA